MSETYNPFMGRTREDLIFILGNAEIELKSLKTYPEREDWEEDRIEDLEQNIKYLQEAIERTPERDLDQLAAIQAKELDRADIGTTAQSHAVYLLYNETAEWDELTKKGTDFREMIEYLQAMEREARNYEERTLSQLAKATGATEELKRRDPDQWRRLMNNCEAQLRELIRTQIVSNG